MAERATEAPRMRAVLVTDLSGFTRTTRKHGVLQSASNIIRMRQIAMPVVHRLGMIDLGTEGDNLLMTFPDIGAALQAAYELQQLWQRHDTILPPGREQFKINPSGLAVAWGAAKRRGDELTGRGVKRAYHLAEDEAEGGQILIGPVVQEMLASQGLGALSKPVGEGEMHELVPSEQMQDVFIEQGPAASVDDDRYLHPNLFLLAQRHDPEADLDALDADLRARFIHEGLAAVLFRLNGESSEAERLQAIEAVHGSLDGASGVVRYEDVDVQADPGLIFFKTSGDALRAVMVACKNCDGAVVTGWGIHQGDVLLVPGTDVHWGDPVNTASKIGQDLAEPGEVLVSALAHQELPSDILEAYDFTEKEVTASGVEFHPFRVEEK